jgi:hypothetical protein
MVGRWVAADEEEEIAMFDVVECDGRGTAAYRLGQRDAACLMAVK